MCENNHLDLCLSTLYAVLLTFLISNLTFGNIAKWVFLFPLSIFLNFWESVDISMRIDSMLPRAKFYNAIVILRRPPILLHSKTFCGLAV